MRTGKRPRRLRTRRSTQLVPDVSWSPARQSQPRKDRSCSLDASLETASPSLARALWGPRGTPAGSGCGPLQAYPGQACPATRPRSSQINPPQANIGFQLSARRTTDRSMPKCRWRFSRARPSSPPGLADLGDHLPGIRPRLRGALPANRPEVRRMVTITFDATAGLDLRAERLLQPGDGRIRANRASPINVFDTELQGTVVARSSSSGPRSRPTRRCEATLEKAIEEEWSLEVGPGSGS